LLVRPPGLDWEQVVKVGVHNRMHTLLDGVLPLMNQAMPLPVPAQQALDDAAAIYINCARLFKTG